MVLISTPAIAQETAPRTNLSIFQSKTLDYALLEYGMLAARRERGLMNEGLRSQFVFALERLVEVYCMPDLSVSLEYVGPATGEECLTHLEELETFHPNNPVALCARHGIDSDSCIDAYRSQFISNYSAPSQSEGLIDSQDFLVKLNAPSEAEIAETKSMYAIRSKFKKEPTPENKQAYEKALNVQIRERCNPVRYRLSLSPLEKSYRADYKEEKDTGDPLKELVDLYSNPNDAADIRGDRVTTNSRSTRKAPYKNKQKENKPQKKEDYAGLTVNAQEEEAVSYPEAWRVRYLPAGCETALKDAFNFDIQFPQAICYREGFMAPACIRALRAQRTRLQKFQKERQRKETAAAPKESPNGFTSF
jgi:hypothetical protein